VRRGLVVGALLVGAIWYGSDRFHDAQDYAWMQSTTAAQQPVHPPAKLALPPRTAHVPPVVRPASPPPRVLGTRPSTRPSNKSFNPGIPAAAPVPTVEPAPPQSAPRECPSGSVTLTGDIDWWTAPPPGGQDWEEYGYLSVSGKVHNETSASVELAYSHGPTVDVYDAHGSRHSGISTRFDKAGDAGRFQGTDAGHFILPPGASVDFEGDDMSPYGLPDVPLSTEVPFLGQLGMWLDVEHYGCPLVQ
jgi:hypothetical protein